MAPQPRQDHIVWEDYFMGLAVLSAKRSKDPNTQVGACIVNENNRIISLGYNGMPNNCHDDIFPWGKNQDQEINEKKLYVCHAELNAYVNKHTADVKNCTMYTTLFPCNECAKIIVQSGIKVVVYLSNRDQLQFKIARIIFDAAGVRYTHFQPREKQIVLKIAPKQCEV